MRTALGTDAVAAVGAAAFWWGTGQGGALTSEAARRLDISRNTLARLLKVQEERTP